jgi:FAD:protein FMN transferase
MRSPSHPRAPASTLPATAELRRARPLLGTLVDISVSRDTDRSEAELQEAVNAAFGQIERIHLLMSFHDPASDLARLNHLAWQAPVTVHEDTYTVLSCALSFAARSAGAFDPCVARELERFGLLPRVSDLTTARETASWLDIELLDGNQVRFKRPLVVDLGGIAKGYAVDVAVNCLRRHGVESALVNAGGDLRVVGQSARSVALRDPADPSKFRHVLSVQDAAIATSAAYYSRCVRGGAEVSALIDGRRRDAYTGTGSISVIAPNCMWADALTKVVLFADPDRCRILLTQCEAEALRLDA